MAGMKAVALTWLNRCFGLSVAAKCLSIYVHGVYCLSHVDIHLLGGSLVAALHYGKQDWAAQFFFMIHDFEAKMMQDPVHWIGLIWKGGRLKKEQHRQVGGTLHR
jgi:hypothetical protein